MSYIANIKRSLSTIRTELELLQASNVLTLEQMEIFLAQLPVCKVYFQMGTALE